MSRKLHDSKSDFRNRNILAFCLFVMLGILTIACVTKTVILNGNTIENQIVSYNVTSAFRQDLIDYTSDTFIKNGLNTSNIDDIITQNRTEDIIKSFSAGQFKSKVGYTSASSKQEIDELMQIMKNLTAEGKSILFISHKLNEIMAVSNRVTVLRKGKYVGTVETKDTDKQALSNMMVGRPVQLQVSKEPAQPGEVVLDVKGLRVPSKTHKKDAVQDISFQVRAGEIVCIAGIDGNGQSELIFGLTGLEKCSAGSINLCGEEISHSAIRKRLKHLSHIPEDRHKHGLVLDFTLEQNMVLQRFRETRFEKAGFLKKDAIREYANVLIEQYDVRSGQGPVTIARSMSGGNQQKAIIARELDRDKPLIIAVQPTRGLDVGAIEYIHKQLVAERDKGKAVLLVSLELDEVMSLSDRILVLYDGQIVGQLDPKQTNIQELGLYMSGAKRDEEGGDAI